MCFKVLHPCWSIFHLKKHMIDRVSAFGWFWLLVSGFFVKICIWIVFSPWASILLKTNTLKLCAHEGFFFLWKTIKHMVDTVSIFYEIWTVFRISNIKIQYSIFLEKSIWIVISIWANILLKMCVFQFLAHEWTFFLLKT